MLSMATKQPLQFAQTFKNIFNTYSFLKIAPHAGKSLAWNYSMITHFLDNI